MLGVTKWLSIDLLPRTNERTNERTNQKNELKKGRRKEGRKEGREELVVPSRNRPSANSWFALFFFLSSVCYVPVVHTKRMMNTSLT